MIEREINRRLNHWKIVLALCLTSLATVSCGSLEKNFKPTLTPAPTPTTFPAYKYYFPIPQVTQIAPDQSCQRKHFETFETFGTTQGYYPGPDLWPNHQVVEITIPPILANPKETTAILFPATEKTTFSVVIDDVQSVAEFQLSPSCDQNRILAQWVQGEQNDSVYFADLPNRKFVAIKKAGPRAELVMKLVKIYSHPNSSEFTEIPMTIVP